MQINVKDEQAAKTWLDEVKGINEDYFTAMKEAGQELERVRDVADGTLVDELVNYGTTICNVAENTFKAIDKIADTVTSIVNKIKQFSDNVTQGLSGVVKKLFG